MHGRNFYQKRCTRSAILKPIVISLDKLQSDETNKGDVFEIWMDLPLKCPDEYMPMLILSC